MHITIFETDHFEVAYTLIRLFQHPSNKLTIFVHPASYRQLEQMPDIKTCVHDWVIKKEDQSNAGFIYRLYRHLKKQNPELLYLGTVTSNFIFFAWLVRARKNIRTILTVHDINSFFFYKSDGSFRRFVRNTGKKKLIRAIREYTVINPRMMEYLGNLLPASKQVRYIPGAFFDEDFYLAPPKSLKPFKIVVPGSVDSRRRNYNQVFELLEECRRLKIPVEITLLGGFHPEYGATIRTRCLEYGKEFPNLHWFDDEIVDHSVFATVINDSHFIWAPCVIKTVISDDVEEVYGLSISSGNIGDIIRFARPAIVPVALQTGTELTQVAIRYDHIKEIPEQLMLLRDNPEKYEVFVKRALEGSGQFTLDQLRNSHPDVFMVNS